MTPILLLHGALGSKSQLEPLKDLLESRNQIVYSLNFSGHSREVFAENFGIEQFADDVLKFLQNNKISRIKIFGYSMGGYVAVWIALHHPELIEGIVTLGTKFDWDPESAKREVKKLDADKIEEKVPAFARILQQRHAPEMWRELLHRTSDMMLKLGSKPLLNDENLHSIQTPVTICLGDRDDMADRGFSEKVATILPNGKFVLLENTIHPIEKADIEKLAGLILEE